MKLSHVVEVLLLAAALALGWVGMGLALEGAIAQAGLPAEVLNATTGALGKALFAARREFALGALALLLGRFWSARGGSGDDIAAWTVLPATFAMASIGATLQWGYSRPLVEVALGTPNSIAVGNSAWQVATGGSSFARGVLLGGLGGLLIQAIPRSWDRATRVLRWGLSAFSMAALVALGLFGSGPGGGGPKINLFGIQPIELAKASFVMALALWLGMWLPKLRTHRRRVLGVPLPRPTLIAPALGLLVALFSGLFFVEDLGPTLILSIVFVAMLAAATGAWTETTAVLIGVVGLATALVTGPRELLPNIVGVRLDMWLEPWRNGMSNGDQLARGLWAMAAGGLFGQGPGRAMFGTVWAGHNDLALANLGEVGGFTGLLFYLLLFAVLVGTGLRIAWSGRTAERMLLAGGISLFFLAQLFVIAGGTFGVLPLTGVVVPMLSSGRTSMIVFLGLAAMLARLAREGKARGATETQAGLRRSLQGLLAVFFVSWSGLVGLAYYATVTTAEARSAESILLSGGDGAAMLKLNPRISAMLRSIPPGEILDRHGEVLRGVDPSGHRTWPMGNSLGTLLGRTLDAPGTWPVPPEPWSIEASFAERLRGYPNQPQPIGIWEEYWTEPPQTHRQFLFSVPDGVLRHSDRERAQSRARHEGSGVRFYRLPLPDVQSFAPLLGQTLEERALALSAIQQDSGSRTVKLSLDAQLQAAAARALAEHVPSGGPAGSAVVIDVDTGQVLVRAQAPDMDLAHYEGERLQSIRAEASIPESKQSKEARRFLGVYGPWRERTAHGYAQAGSVFKVFTALAMARTELPYVGHQCNAIGKKTYTCALIDGRPAVQRPGWRTAIRDSHRTPDGSIEVTRALEVSCNVFFSQAAVDLGLEAFTELQDAGLTMDGGNFSSNLEQAVQGAGEFALAQTGFGQGAARLSTLEAARMIAAVAAGGISHVCRSLALDEDCEEIRLVDSPDAITPILAGLKKVIDSGTLRGSQLAGLRIYGKTGTADDVGRREEEPWGIRRGSLDYDPHSWVVMFAEAATPGDEACEPTRPGRLAIAVRIDRGGAGAGHAKAVALSVLRAAKDLGYFGELP